MDFYSMKRRELQALCKEQQIPANLSNHEMANRLAEFFKDKKEPLPGGLVDGQDENARKTEIIDVVVNRKGKKVRFSPEHEVIEFTRSKGNLTSTTCSSVSAEYVESGQVNNKNVDTTGRATRARGLKPGDSKENEKKRGRNRGKHHAQENKAASVETFTDSELQESDVTCPRRVTRLRGKVAVEAVKNGSKQERKRARIDDKRDIKTSDRDGAERLIEELVDLPGRHTRTRGQKLMEHAIMKEGVGHALKSDGSAAQVSVEIERKGVVAKNVKRVKHNGKGEEQVLDNQKMEVHLQVEPPKMLRRSKRKASMIGDFEIFNDDARKNDNGGIEALKEAPRLLAVNGSGEDAESTADEVDLDEGIAVEVEEPIKQERSSRRKDGIVSHEERGDAEVKVETENRYPLSNSVQQLGTAHGVSKDSDKKVIKPTQGMRRSRRHTLSLEPVSSDVNLNIGAAVENFEAEKHLRKPVEKTSPVVEKNLRRPRRNALKHKSPEIVHETRRSKRPISRDVTKTNNVSNALTQSMGKGGTKQDAAPAVAAIVEVLDKRRPSSRLKEPHTLDGSSRERFLETGESLSLDAQLSLQEVPENDDHPGSASGISVKNISSDVGLTSSRKGHSKKVEASVADGAGGSESTNSGETACPRTADVTADQTVSVKEISASKFMVVENVHSLLGFEVGESTEQYVSETAKNELEVQVFGQTEDSGSNSTTDSCQIHQEGSNVSRNVGCAENSFSADSVLLHDQTGFKISEATEGEVNKHAQPRLDALDHVPEARDVSVPPNLESIEAGNNNVVSSPISCEHKDVDHLKISNSSHENKNNGTFLKAGEASAFVSHERLSSMLRINLEDDNPAGGDETDEDECSKGHKNASENEGSDSFDGARSVGIIHQGTFEDDYSLANFDEEGKHDSSLAVAPVTLCADSTETNLNRSLEDHIAKPHETSIDDCINLQSAKTDKGGSSMDHKSGSNEDGDFMSVLFDAEINGSIASQHGEAISTEYSENGSDKQGMFHDISAEVTMSGTCTSSLQGIALTMPNDVSESHAGGAAGDSYEGKTNATCQSHMPGEIICTTNIIKDGEHVNENQADESSNGNACEPSAEANSPLAKPTAYDGNLHGEEAWSNRTEKGHSFPIFNMNSEYENRPDVHGSNTNYGDVVCSFEYTESKLGVENQRKLASENMEEAGYQCNNSLTQHSISSPGDDYRDVESSQCWTDIDLNNLFGTTVDGFTLTGPTDASPQATEAVNLTMSTKRSLVNSGGSLFKNKEMEGKGSAKTSDKSMGLPRKLKEACETGSSVDWEENQLELLFATPITAVSKTLAPDRIFDKTVSLKEGSVTMMENVVTQTKSDEEMKDASPGVKSSPGPENPSSDNSEDATFAEFNNIDSVELLDAVSPKVPSEDEYQIHEAFEERLTENTCEYWEETKLNEYCMELVHATTSIPSATECEVCEASEAQLTKNGCEFRGKRELSEVESMVLVNTCTTNVPSEAEHNANEALEAQLCEETCECKEEPEFNKVENMELVNVCTTAVLSEAEHNIGEVVEEQLTETDECMEELQNNEIASVGLLNTCSTQAEFNDGETPVEQVVENTGDYMENAKSREVESVDSVNTCTNEAPSESDPIACEASKEQSTDDACECKEGSQSKEVENMDLVNACTTEVSPEAEYKVCEVSAKQLTENEIESGEETCSLTANEDEKIFNLGQYCQYEEATNKDSELSKKGITASPGNLCEAEVCPDMLMDRNYSENLICGNSAFESLDSGVQKFTVPENSHPVIACNVDDSIPAETLVDNFNAPQDPDRENASGFDGERDLKDKGISSSIYYEEDASYEAMILDGTDGNLRSSCGKFNELHASTDAAVLEVTDGYALGHEADKPPGTPELESTIKETREEGSITQDAHSIVPEENESPASVARSDDIISSSAMHLLLGEKENGGVEKSEAGIPFFGSEVDHELHFEAKSEELSADVDTALNVPTSGYNEILKESDVADTIKEYIDSESSPAAASYESGPNLPIEVFSHLEERASDNAALVESQEDIDGNHPNTNGDNLKPSIEIEMNELNEAALPVEPVSELTKALKSPPRITSEEGSAFDTILEMEPGDSHRPCSKQLHSTAKQNARTILIHGTPRKPHTAVDMKENAPSHKASNIGDFTTARPAKRRALQDVKWK